MAQNTRMQQRYGTYSQFLADKNNLLPNELASVASGDPNTADGKSLNFAFAPGDTKRLMTAEDAQDEIQAAASQATADAEESAQKAQDYYNQIAPAVENAKDELDNYTDALKGTIPLDYTELSEKVQQMEIMKAPVIQGKDSGEFVTLSDSGDIPTKNVRLFGKSVQNPTTGAQLFDVMAGKNEDASQYKITINDYTTGTFTVSIGNPSGALPMPKNTLSDWCPTMTAGKTYYLSGDADSTANKYIGIKNVSGNWSFGTSRQITESDLQSVVQFGFGTYSNIMIVEGSTEKPYEVYTGGEPATEPSPEYPLPITSAGNYDEEFEKYEIGIGVTGKNLFNASKVPTKSQGGATVTNNGDGSFTVSGSGKLTESFADNYIIPHNEMVRFFKVGTVKIYTEMSTHPYFYVNLYKGKKFIKVLVSSAYDTAGRFEIEKEYFEDEAYYLILGINGNNNATIVPGTIKPFLYQEGDSIWEPFKQQLSTLQIPNPLRGIPVNSGGNYTDAEGQQWLCDYIDRERGKYVQCVQEIVFDGSEDESWSKNGGTSGDNNYLYYIILNNKGHDDVICDYLPTKTVSYINTTGDNYIGISGSGINKKTIYINVGHLMGDNDVKNLKTWLSNNPITVIYQLVTPIETDLTPEQIAALDLSTYQGITNIGTDTMPQVGVEVEYGCDTKIYIDNKFAELAQSLAATQNQILGVN